MIVNVEKFPPISDINIAIFPSVLQYENGAECITWLSLFKEKGSLALQMEVESLQVLNIRMQNRWLKQNNRIIAS